MKHPLRLGWTALLAPAALLAFEAPATAQPPRPIHVEYVAPLQCASRAALQAELEAEVARWPNPGRVWSWSLHIRESDGAYEGRLTSEGGVWIATATRCDDITTELGLVIAKAAPAPPSTELPPAPPAQPAEPRPVATSPIEWRLGTRAQVSNHAPGGGAIASGMGLLSVEVPGGFHKMMFEVGLGGGSALGRTYPLSYTVLDTQACLLDIPLGSGSGLSVLGCVRLAGASFTNVYHDARTQFPETGGALWVGAGGRLRWQSGASLFLEGSVNGVYGTVSGGESNDPGWIEGGVSVGLRL